MLYKAVVRGPLPAGALTRSLVVASVVALVLLASGLGCQLPPGAVAPVGAPDGGVVDARAEAPDDVVESVGTRDASADAAAPPADGAGSTILHLTVHDATTGKPLPAKIFLRDATTDTPLHFGDFLEQPLCMGMAGSLREVGEGGALATYNGLALWNGEARLPIGTTWDVPDNGCESADAGVPAHRDGIPFGRYAIVAARGLEYELTTAVVDLEPGRGEISIDLPLSRTVDTRGYFAADMHIHSGSADGSGSWDSLVSPDNRVKTEAVSGVEVVVSSDHDYNTDLGLPIARLWGASPPMASIIGDEASASFGHFNAMPVTTDAARPSTNGALAPDQIQLMSPKQLFDRLHALPTAPLIQLNHPRLPFAAYFNDMRACDWHDLSQLPRCSLDFEALEVLNGWLACGGKVHETLADWYALMGFGVTLTATGNSDTHGSSNIEAGFPRSYVRVADDTVPAFDEAEFVGAVRAHRVIATTGPFLTLRVGSSGEGDLVRPVHTPTAAQVRVSLRLQAASWVKVDVVRLLVDGRVVKTWNVPVSNGAPASLFQIDDEPVTVTADAAITAEAEGATPLPPWMVGQFLLDPNMIHLCGDPAQPGMIPFAVTNPVFVDADGDGMFRAAMAASRAAAVHDVWVPPPVGPNDCNPLAAIRGR
jgi:hypothetical protein